MSCNETVCALAALACLAGCATAASTPDAGSDERPDAMSGPPDAAPSDASPPGQSFFFDDDPEDFQGTKEGVVITSGGSVEPVAYLSGGLLARASDTGTLASGSGASWVDVQAMTMTSVTGVSRGLDRSWGSGTPAGLGLTSGDSFTIALEGEIYLEAGAWQFHLQVDDRGFVDIAQPGTSNFARAVSADTTTEASGSFNAANTGWYPIRIAMSEIGGSAALHLRATPPGGVKGAIGRHLLRSRVDGLTGLYMAAFDDSYSLGSHEAFIDSSTPGNADWASSYPGGLGLSNGDHFSVCWAGQMWIETAGSYSYRFVSDDGQRMWIDGSLILDAWDETAHDNTSAGVNLEVGWHDLIIDQMEIGGAAQATVSVASGPEGSGLPLAVARLRPVITNRQRYDTGFNRTDYPIPDLGSVESPLAINAPPGAKVAGLSVSWSFDHTYQGDLEIRLIAPDGSVVVLRDNTGGGTGGTVTQRMFTSALDGASASGTWNLRVSDTASLDSGTLRDFQLTVYHASGAPSFPLTSAYISPIKNLGPDVRSYTSLSWLATAAAGASVQLRARSGDTEENLSASEWSTPILDPGGGPPPVAAKQYFQYKIEITSDGDGAPSVDWVRLDFTTDTQ